MDANTVGLILGLFGITSSLLTSGFNTYLTYKARSNMLKETLYNSQIEILRKIIHKQERFRVYATVLQGDDDALKVQARQGMEYSFVDFNRMQEEGAAILPTNLWIEVRRLNAFMADIIALFNKNQSVSEKSMEELVAKMSKVVLLTRAAIGVDELTKDSLKLFSSEKHYNDLANLKMDFFKDIRRKANLTESQNE